MYTYTLFININENDNVYLEHEWEYRHKSVSNPLKISMSDQKIKIFMSISTKYDNFLDIVKNSRAFGPAIEKSLIIHIILYSGMISINDISCVRVEGNKKKAKSCLPIKESISSLISGNLEYSFPDEWRNDNEWIEHFINDKNEDNPLSALYSLVISKNKKYEIERFQYLWITMNGMYGWYCKKIEQYSEKWAKEALRVKSLSSDEKSSFKISDSGGIYEFYKFHGWKDSYIGQEDSKLIAERIPEILNDMDMDNIEGISKEDFEGNGRYKEIATKIENELVQKTGEKYKTCAYVYLLTRLPYQYRCDLFHANDPIPIFNISKKELKKYNINTLKILNIIMNSYFDLNLYKWFESEEKRRLEEEACNVAIEKVVRFLEKKFKLKDRNKIDESKLKSKRNALEGLLGIIEREHLSEKAKSVVTDSYK